MNVYRQASKSDFLGVLVVDRADAASSTLRRRSGDTSFEVPTNSWAGICAWNTGYLRVFASSTIPLPLSDSQSEYKILKVDAEADSCVALYTTFAGKTHPNTAYKANLAILQVPDEAVEKLGFLQITLTRQDPLINSFSSHSVNLELTSAPPLSYTLQKIAHFYFHLGRRPSPSKAFLDWNSLSVPKHVALYMNRLDRDDVGFLQPGSKITLKDNTFHLDAECTRCYSLTISNKSHRDFYPYLFYFNPGDYSITVGVGPCLHFKR
jgi:hypothetical protein